MTLGIFTWRGAIRASKLPPCAKLICYNLSTYMNDLGEGCWPSLSRQAEDTGLCRASVLTHLKVARQAGYVKIERMRNGNKWGHNRYKPSWPEGLQPGGESVTVCGPGDSPTDTFESLPARRGRPGDRPKVGQEIDTNSPLEESIEESIKGEGLGDIPYGGLTLSDKPLKKSGHKKGWLTGEAVGAGIRGTQIVPGMFR